MKRILCAAVFIFAALATYLLVAEAHERAARTNVEQQINRLTESVDRLAEVMERMLREQRSLADVNLVEGNTAIGRPQVLQWESGGKTIKLSVYRATTSETKEEWTTRTSGFVSQYEAPGQYPPDV